MLASLDWNVKGDVPLAVVRVRALPLCHGAHRRLQVEPPSVDQVSSCPPLELRVTPDVLSALVQVASPRRRWLDEPTMCCGLLGSAERKTYASSPGTGAPGAMLMRAASSDSLVHGILGAFPGTTEGDARVSSASV